MEQRRRTRDSEGPEPTQPPTKKPKGESPADGNGGTVVVHVSLAPADVPAREVPMVQNRYTEKHRFRNSIGVNSPKNPGGGFLVQRTIKGTKKKAGREYGTLREAMIGHDRWLLTECGLAADEARRMGLNIDLGFHNDEEIRVLLVGTSEEYAFEKAHMGGLQRVMRGKAAKGVKSSKAAAKGKDKEAAARLGDKEKSPVASSPPGISAGASAFDSFEGSRDEGTSGLRLDGGGAAGLEGAEGAEGPEAKPQLETEAQGKKAKPEDKGRAATPPVMMRPPLDRPGSNFGVVVENRIGYVPGSFRVFRKAGGYTFEMSNFPNEEAAATWHDMELIRRLGAPEAAAAGLNYFFVGKRFKSDKVKRALQKGGVDEATVPPIPVAPDPSEDGATMLAVGALMDMTGARPQPLGGKGKGGLLSSSVQGPNGRGVPPPPKFDAGGAGAGGGPKGGAKGKGKAGTQAAAAAAVATPTSAEKRGPTLGAGPSRPAAAAAAAKADPPSAQWAPPVQRQAANGAGKAAAGAPTAPSAGAKTAKAAAKLSAAAANGGAKPASRNAGQASAAPGPGPSGPSLCDSLGLATFNARAAEPEAVMEKLRDVATHVLDFYASTSEGDREELASLARLEPGQVLRSSWFSACRLNAKSAGPESLQEMCLEVISVMRDEARRGRLAEAAGAVEVMAWFYQAK